MGGYENVSPDCAYVFMRPSSIPVAQCTRDISPVNQDQENLYMIPRSVTSFEESDIFHPYAMVDMSGLQDSPEHPSVVSGVTIRNSPDDLSGMRTRHHRLDAVTRSPETQSSRTFTYQSKAKSKVSTGGGRSFPDSTGDSPGHQECFSERNIYENMSGCKPSQSSNIDWMNKNNRSFKRNMRDQNHDVSHPAATSSDIGFSQPSNIRSQPKPIESKALPKSENKIDEEMLNVPVTEVQCYYLDPVEPSVSPSLPLYDPPKPPVLTLGQRRLPPTPDEAYCSQVNDQEKHALNVIHQSPLPDSPPSKSTYKQTPSTAGSDFRQFPHKPKPLVIQNTQESTQHSPSRKDLELSIQSPKHSTTKAKAASLFGRSILAKNSVFGKNPKQEKQKQSPNEGQGKIVSGGKPGNGSPKFTRKIHPIADLIKKRRTTMHALLVSASSQRRSNKDAEKVSKFSTTISSAKAPHANTPCKFILTPTKSLPTSVTTSIENSPTSKEIAVGSSPSSNFNCDFKPNSSDSVNTKKCSNKPEHMRVKPPHNQSFLYQKATECVKPRKEDKVSPVKRNLSRAHTFDGITATELENGSYEVPFYLQQAAATNKISAESLNEGKLSDNSRNNTISPSNSELQFSGIKKSESLRGESNQSVQELASVFDSNEKPIRNEKYIASGISNKRNPSSPTLKSNPSSNKTPPTNSANQQQATNKAPPARPPPPSLKKIREARLKAGAEVNRSQSERWGSNNSNRISPTQIRRRYAERPKHLSNPDMTPTQDEDVGYSSIRDITNESQNRASSGKSSCNNNNFKGCASSVSAIRSRFEPGFQRTGNISIGGSVESVRSDSSEKETNEGAIYEDIDCSLLSGFNGGSGFNKGAIWASSH